MSLKNWGRIAGLFGLVVLFSAVFNWLFVTGDVTSRAVLARFVAGIVGVAFWLTTNRGEHPLGRGAFFGLVSAVSGLVLVGVVDELGPDVNEWHTGQRVGVGWTASSCMHCHVCLSGDQSAACDGTRSRYRQSDRKCAGWGDGELVLHAEEGSARNQNQWQRE